MDTFLTYLQDPWTFYPIGYFTTIAIELPILCLGLAREHPMSRRVLTGFWLTACTYPLVVFVVPYWFHPTHQRIAYLIVAESIAHFGECVLFYLAFAPLQQWWRDMAAEDWRDLSSQDGWVVPPHW